MVCGSTEVGGLLPWCEGHVVIWFIENLNGTSAARSHSSRRGAHLGRNPQVSLRKLVEAKSEKGAWETFPEGK